MKKVTSEITYAVCDSVGELPAGLAMLCRRAEEARESAYAPYSHFHVGAAVLLANGQTVIGSNQENAAYPSGLCAERVAVFAASSQYPGIEIEAIAVSVSGNPGGPVSPCGNCRQVMAEYEHRQKKGITLLIPGGNGSIILFHDIGTLLPFVFSQEQLGNIDN